VASESRDSESAAQCLDSTLHTLKEGRLFFIVAASDTFTSHQEEHWRKRMKKEDARPSLGAQLIAILHLWMSRWQLLTAGSIMVRKGTFVADTFLFAYDLTLSIGQTSGEQTAKDVAMFAVMASLVGVVTVLPFKILFKLAV
jgi:uncharacterized membrane protein